MKVIIAGCRWFEDYFTLVRAISESEFDITEIFSGNAQGVDSLGNQYAKMNNIPLRIFKAEWKKYGKSAGPRRNQQMVDEADALIALWDFKSIGTKDTITKAQQKNLKVFVYGIPPQTIL
jgi:hypothetical protein